MCPKLNKNKLAIRVPTSVVKASLDTACLCLIHMLRMKKRALTTM